MAHRRTSRYADPGQFQEEAEGRIHQAYGRAQEVVGDNPGYSALACFGIGLCVGAGVTLLLGSPKREKLWYEDYVPSDLSHSDFAKHVRATVGHMLPDAVARYMKRR